MTINLFREIAGWSRLVARQAHNLKVAGSNPAPATNFLPAGRQEPFVGLVLAEGFVFGGPAEIPPC